MHKKNYQKNIKEKQNLKEKYTKKNIYENPKRK